MLKVLNLYAGIGGNRKLWTNVEVTAVENNPQIASQYQKLFPQDTVIVADAHQYLLDHYEEFDFIWTSPPCPTHSAIRRCGVHAGIHSPKYPEMELYQEIIFLTHFALEKTKWVVENVKPYYTPLIKPFMAGRHCFWANFVIPQDKIVDDRVHNDIHGGSKVYGFDLKGSDISDKRETLRNLVNPKLGLYVFNCAFKDKQRTLE